MSADDAVLDQWDILADAAELIEVLEDARLVADDHGASFDGLAVHVVPCVPMDRFVARGRVTGVKLARIDGRIGLYLFAGSEE